MDALHLVSPSSINSFKVDWQKAPKGPVHDVTDPVKSFTPRRVPGSDVRQRSRNRTLTNKVTNLSNSSSQSSITCSNSSYVVQQRSSSFKSSCVFIENPEGDNIVKRNSKNKPRKKGKQNRKISRDSVSTGPEVLFEDYAQGVLNSETSGNIDMNYGKGLVSCATSLEDSFLDNKINMTNVEDDNNGISNSSESPKTCTSYIDEDGRVEETYPLQISCCDGIHSNGFSDMHDCRALDSVSVGSNSDNSTSASYVAKPYDNQGLNSGNLQVAVPGKRNKKAKMVPGSSKAVKARSASNSQVRTGKENNHCVWQKVQKNDADECNSESKKASVFCSRFHGTLKEPSSLRRNSDMTDVNIPSKTEDKKQLKDKVSRKLKRKICPGSKQEYNSYSRRATFPSKASSNACGKIGSQQIEILDTSALVNNQKRVSSALRSRSQIGSPEFGFQGSKGESLNSESSLSSQNCPQNLESTESVCNTVSAVKEHQDSSFATSFCSLDKMNVLEMPSPVYLPHLIVNKVARKEKDTSLAEHGKQNHISGSLQKRIPIGTKDPQSTTSVKCGSLQLAHADGQGAEDWTLRNNVDEKAASNSQNLISSLNVGMMSMGLNSESNSLQEDENNIRRVRSMNAHAFKGNNRVAAVCLISESKDKNYSAFEADINKIAQAVDSACRMQAASKAVQMATGGPISEFERFLHFSSPVICHPLNLISSKNCSEDQVLGASLCRHETPNFSLGCLWQWYEKHGSYGLEVRGEEYEQSNRLGVDRFSFRAYFVPFLSAIQLLRNCKSHSSNNGHGFPTSETGQNLQSSANTGHLPIFSVVVPQPRPSDESYLPPVKELCKSERSSVSDNDDWSVPSADTTRSDDLELLFEYFESEQPWQRRPLYEKIQELVTGERPSNCSFYGDPTNLNTINLHDLHPASWYAVAWYPIYRIPDGNFRAAFLTYHSLGHMVHRSAKVDTANAEACIVSPAVGLQSYSAQSECWFQLRHSASSHTAESSSLNPSGILKERLRTLEETACVMSRAVVNKGNQTSVNSHSDFEFFLSRRLGGLP